MSAVTRGDRRRKLLRDESRVAGDASTPSGNRRASRRRAYSDAARESAQPRITDLIPRSFWWLLVIALGMMLLPSSMVASHMLSKRLLHSEGAARLTSFALWEVGSITRWWTAVSLLMSAAICLLILHLRRHKLDDYRGRYRLWFWSAVVLIIASVDATTNLHRDVQALIAGSTSAAWAATLATWIPAAALGIAALALLRSWLDMYSSRAAATTMFFSGVCLVATTPVVVKNWPVLDPQLQQVATFAVLQFGLQLLFVSLLTYARHVFFVSQGMLKPKSRRAASAKRKKSTPPVPDDQDEDAENRNESAAEPSHYDAKRSGPNRSNTSASPDVDDDSGLSRTERRKREKELRRQHRRAA